MLRIDPGPCPICGTAHSACTASGQGPIAVQQLPQRDGAAPATIVVAAPAAPRLQADKVQEALPAGQHTSGTYRGRRTGRR
jgi:hypothetical protein